MCSAKTQNTKHLYRKYVLNKSISNNMPSPTCQHALPSIIIKAIDLFTMIKNDIHIIIILSFIKNHNELITAHYMMIAYLTIR